ncbi:hypothetical protein BKI51_21320 [Alphaproteobacteria bacterium AO1-B]|nr:hypothetical protein BKI51_21320 [Alphaproteobacteria bacterium AO1-B]
MPLPPPIVSSLQQNETQRPDLAALRIDSQGFPGKKSAVSNFVECEFPMTRLKADILDMMSEALASVTFMRGGTMTPAKATFKHTTKTTKTTA